MPAKIETISLQILGEIVDRVLLDEPLQEAMDACLGSITPSLPLDRQILFYNAFNLVRAALIASSDRLKEFDPEAIAAEIKERVELLYNNWELNDKGEYEKHFTDMASKVKFVRAFQDTLRIEVRLINPEEDLRVIITPDQYQQLGLLAEGQANGLGRQ